MVVPPDGASMADDVLLIWIVISSFTPHTKHKVFRSNRVGVLLLVGEGCTQPSGSCYSYGTGGGDD